MLKRLINNFFSVYSSTGIISKLTCYKNPEKPSFIDQTLTICPRSFQNSYAMETGLSEFHKMAIIVIKTTIRKLEPKSIGITMSTIFAMILSGSL